MSNPAEEWPWWDSDETPDLIQSVYESWRDYQVNERVHLHPDDKVSWVEEGECLMEQTWAIREGLA